MGLVIDLSSWPLFAVGCCSEMVVKTGLTVLAFKLINLGRLENIG
jgi:hypothetical protein